MDRDHLGKCVCGKIKYWDERRARTALVGAIIHKNLGRNHRKEQRVYKCPICNYWHLTSETRSEYERRRAAEQRQTVHVVRVTASDDSTGSDHTSTLSGQVWA